METENKISIGDVLIASLDQELSIEIDNREIKSTSLSGPLLNISAPSWSNTGERLNKRNHNLSNSYIQLKKKRDENKQNDQRNVSQNMAKSSYTRRPGRASRYHVDFLQTPDCKNKHSKTRPKLIAKRCSKRDVLQTATQHMAEFYFNLSKIAKWNEYMPRVRLKSFRNTLKSSLHDKHNVIPDYYQLPLFQQVINERCLFHQRVLEGELEFKRYKEEMRKNIRGNRTCGYKDEHYLWLTKLLKDSLMAHQFENLILNVMWLCFSPKHFPEMLWKIGNFVLKSTQNGLSSLLNFQTLLTELLYHKHQPEAVLDYAIYILKTKRDVQEAYQILTEAVALSNYSEDIYFNILYGQVEYILWKKAWERNKYVDNTFVRQNNRWGDDEEDFEEFEEHFSSQDNNTEISFHGRRALKYLSHVEERMGLWDCVLPKYCDLLNYFCDKSKVMEVLLKHLHNNPNNPTSYRLLYEETRRAACEIGNVEDFKCDDDSFSFLNQLFKLNPNDDLVKCLIEYCIDKDSLVEVLDIVLVRLSHIMLFDSLFDWRIMHKLWQRSSLIVKQKLHNIKTFLAVHFTVPLSTRDKKATAELLHFKAEVAASMELQNYCKHVKDWLYNQEQTTVHNHTVLRRSVSLSCKGNDVMEPLIDYELSLSSPELIDTDSLSEEEYDEIEMEIHLPKQEDCPTFDQDVLSYSSGVTDDECYSENLRTHVMSRKRKTSSPMSTDGKMAKVDLVINDNTVIKSLRTKVNLIAPCKLSRQSDDTVSSISSSSDDDEALQTLR